MNTDKTRIQTNPETQRRLTVEQRRRAVELEEQISFSGVYGAAAEIIWARDEIARLHSVYESAVVGRQQFREAYLQARGLLSRLAAAWDEGGENMDRLCEQARNFTPSKPDPYANAPLTGPGSRLHADLNALCDCPAPGTSNSSWSPFCPVHAHEPKSS